MASSSIYNKLKLHVWFLITLNLSISMHVVSASTSSHDQYVVSFSLTHRDAESSPLRSVEADPADLPEDMPMRAFVAAGRALTKRLDMQHGIKAKKPFVGKTSYGGDAVGDFFLTVGVGTPSQNLAFLLDTGSELIWTQCSPCLQCTNTTVRRFDYHQSSSFLSVAYTSALCISSVGLKTYIKPPLCRFQVHYLDGSGEDGFLSTDFFHLGPAVISKPFVFGCANFVNETVFTPSSGLMGLDAGPFSLTSQIFAGNPEMPKKFAYCLPDRIKSLNMPGRIKFGNYRQHAKMRYTPFAPPYGPLGSAYYYVKLEGIAVGETMIKVHNVEAEGGTIFDSGTAITQLVPRVYDGMLREMKRQTTHLGPLEITNATSNGASRLCYLVPLNATKLPKVPRISMHFAGGVELQLVPGSILRPLGLIIDNTTTVFCLAFDSSAEDENLIGNYQQQDYLVEHNLETSSLGLAKAECANYK